MTNEANTDKGGNRSRQRGLIASFFLGLAEDAMKFVIAFAVGTGATAVACWYYDVPLVFSLIGGILVLGIALALVSGSLFS